MNPIKDLLASERASMAYLLALVLALLYVSQVYTVDFITGNVAMFAEGDPAQHVSGWLFFRDDEWRFPLLLTQRMNTPEGVSIAFTDSIPLLALPMKLIRGVQPAGFQYIGLWHVVIYLLQALASVYLMRALGARTLYAAVVAVGFALTWPALMMRFGHTSLCTHALILFSFGVYFLARNRGMSPQAAGWRFVLITCVAMMVHPYLLAMCYAVFLAHLVDQSIMHRSIRTSAVFLLISISLIALLAFVLGYFGSSTQTTGFGLYSLNLTAPFCGGRLWNCNMNATGGQGFEGYNYFGAGFLAICPLVVWFNLRAFASTMRRYPALSAMVVVVTVYALSNRIFLSSHLLFEYTVPAPLQIITNTFRCSARFFWVVSYLLLFVVLSQALVLREVWIRVFVVAALGLQIYDMSVVRDIITREINQPAPVAAVNWDELLQDVDTIEVYPVYGCNEAYEHFQLHWQLIAGRHGKLVNTGYVARAATACRKKHAPFEMDFAPGRLYVVPADRTGGIAYLPAGFQRAVDRRECVVLEQDMLCMPGRNADQLAQRHEKLRPVTFLKKVMQWQIPPIFMGTMVGRKVGNTLVGKPGVPGILGFGPHRTIAAGRYAVRIEFASKGCRDTAGYWDVAVQDGTKILARGDLGQPPAEGRFVVDAEVAGFEVRTFYTGTCDLRLDGITVTRLDEAQESGGR
jgi:hypothetical protein